MTLRRFLVLFLVLMVIAIGVAVWWTGLLTKQYTAKACLVVAPLQPTTLPRPDEKVDWEEFAIFRNNQAELMRERFVIQAALRNNKVRNLPCIVREDQKRNTVAWLTSQIHVSFPDGKSGIMEVSATLPDPKDAAAIVNAIVEAYMDEVVNVDRLKQRERYDSLSTVAADKEDEVRRKREQLKRELESIGAGDGQTNSLRAQMAVSTYAEYQRQLQALKFDRNAFQGQLEAVREAKKALADEKPSELEVSGLLNTMPVYRELFNRRTLNDIQKHRIKTAMGGPADDKVAKQSTSAGSEQPEMSGDELKAVDAMLDELHAHCAQMLLEAKLREAENEMKRLTARIDIASEQIGAFEKEVESKARDADAVGKSSVSAQMQRADLESIERILRQVVDERERLKVELTSPSRVMVWGDANAPAAVPENPD